MTLIIIKNNKKARGASVQAYNRKYEGRIR